MDGRMRTRIWRICPVRFAPAKWTMSDATRLRVHVASRERTYGECHWQALRKRDVRLNIDGSLLATQSSVNRTIRTLPGGPLFIEN